MADDNLGDWRIAVATTLAEDATFPTNPVKTFKAGSPVYVNHLSRSTKYGEIIFITPSLMALNLKIAYDAALSANMIKKEIKPHKIVVDGLAKTTINDVPKLYDYFQFSMVSIVFCFQAIEAFINLSLSRQTNTKFEYKEKGILRYITSEKIEDTFSIVEKIKLFLPQVFSKSLEPNHSLWDKVILLKDDREEIVHMKYENMFTRGQIKSPNNSLFPRLWLKNNIVDYVDTAYSFITYFREEAKTERWQKEFEIILAKGKQTK